MSENSKQSLGYLLGKKVDDEITRLSELIDIHTARVGQIGSAGIHMKAYVEHRKTCAIPNGGVNCTCGLKRVLRAWENA